MARRRMCIKRNATHIADYLLGNSNFGATTARRFCDRFAGLGVTRPSVDLFFELLGTNVQLIPLHRLRSSLLPYLGCSCHRGWQWSQALCPAHSTTKTKKQRFIRFVIEHAASNHYKTTVQTIRKQKQPKKNINNPAPIIRTGMATRWARTEKLRAWVNC